MTNFTWNSDVAAAADAEQASSGERAARLRAAAAEGSLSGELRRAFHHSRMGVPRAATVASVEPLQFADWLEGLAELPSGAMDRLATALQVHLVPIAPDEIGRSDA